MAAERAASCDLRQTCCCASICSAEASLHRLAARRLGFRVNVAIVTLQSPGSADGKAGGKGSQAKPLKESVSSLEGDPQRPAAGKQMDYATEGRTLPVLAVKDVDGRRLCVVM